MNECIIDADTKIILPYYLSFRILFFISTRKNKLQNNKWCSQIN